MYSWNEKDPGGGATLEQHEYGTLCRVAVMVDTGVIVSAFVSSSFAMIQTEFPHLAKSSPLSGRPYEVMQCNVFQSNAMLEGTFLHCFPALSLCIAPQ